MARTLARLSALFVNREKRPGMYADGGGLYLQVTATADAETVSKSWIYRYTLNGHTRAMGIGSLVDVTLAEARIHVARWRKMRREGIDPIDARRAERVKLRTEKAGATSFKACAELYIDAHRVGWRNRKHASQWINTIATYANPVLGDVPVAQVDTDLVLKVLQPIWKTKPETASRLRGRIEEILDWAKVRGFRQNENPARWRGHLAKLLPARSKVRAVKHHAALDYRKLPEFMLRLREQQGIAARALEFTIMTAARTGEVLGATLTEIDEPGRAWTVPAARMKMGREHRIPLADDVLELLGQLPEEEGAEHVFPGQKRGRSLSNMAMLKVLARMGRNDLTTHGFRSTFRDWAAEETDCPREVVEMALAHAIDGRVPRSGVGAVDK